MPISALTKLSHTGQKLPEKTFLERGTLVQPYCEISLLSFIHKIFLTKFLSIRNSLLSADMDL